MKASLSRTLVGLLATAGLIGASVNAQAATATGNFNVNIALTSKCEINSTAAATGAVITDIDLTYTSFQTTAATGSTGFNVRCTNSLPYTLALDSTSVTDAALNLDYADIRVGRYGNADGVTNADGMALVSNLSAYNTNPVRLDASDLPVTAEIDAIEMNAVPAWRSAVRLKFPVRSGRAALLRIILDDGEPAPAGAEIELQGDAQVFYVARRGEAYLTGLQPTNRLRLKHGDSGCDIDVALPEGKADEIVRLGPLKCEGVKR